MAPDLPAGARRPPADHGAAGAAANPLEMLGCGTLLADLLTQVDHGRLEPVDAHQLSCPYCRAALRDVATTGPALALVRAERAVMPAGLVERILRRAQAARGPGPAVELPTTGTLAVAGGIRVGLDVLAGIARTAAGTVPGVRVATCSVVEAEPGGVLDVALGVLVDGSTPLPLLAVALRRVVRPAVRHASGLSDVQVELAALDLLD